MKKLRLCVTHYDQLLKYILIRQKEKAYSSVESFSVLYNLYIGKP